MLSPLLLAALLSAGAASPIVRQQQGTLVAGPTTASRLLASYSFDTVGCHASGTGGVTFARDSIATLWDADGAETTCAANLYRVGCDYGRNEICGLIVEPTRVNWAKQARDLTASPWTQSGTCTPVADQGPANFTDLDKITCTGVNDSRYNPVAVPSSVGPWSLSAWIAPDTGTKTMSITIDPTPNVTTVSCSRSTGGACSVGYGASNAWAYAYAAIPIPPIRSKISATAVSAATTVNSSGHDGRMTANVASGALFGRFQLEEGQQPTTFIPTEATTVERLRDQATVPWPAGAAVSWEVAITAAPLDAGSSWSVDAVLWEAGADAAANSARLRTATDGSLILDVYDSAGTAKTITASHGFNAGSRHTVVAKNVSGTLTLADGYVALVSTVSGAGTAVWGSAPSTLYVGSYSNASAQTTWIIPDVNVCNGRGASKCLPSRADIANSQARWVWGAMPRAQRTDTSRFMAYPFQWPTDPASCANGQIRRAISATGTGSWTTAALTCTAPDSYADRQFRDVSFVYDTAQAKYFYAVNAIRAQANGWGTDRFAIYSSTDGTTLSFVTWVVVPGEPSHVWSPEFFVDDDGSIYAIVSASGNQQPDTAPGGAARFSYRLFLCRDPSSFDSWVYLGALSGAAFPVDGSSNINAIDPYLFKNGSTYTIVWKDENVGSGTYGQMGTASSSSILGPYDTGGVITIPGPATLMGEGASVIEMPEGSEYRWRMYFDDYLPTYAAPARIMYVETDDWATFTAPADPGFATYKRHATVVLGVP